MGELIIRTVIAIGIVVGFFWTCERAIGGWKKGRQHGAKGPEEVRGDGAASEP